MKTIGLIGGTSWVSTIEYYRIINEETHRRLDSYQFGRIILYSVNNGEFKPLMESGNWAEIEKRFIEIGKKLVAAGADCILLCANTKHKIADGVQKNISVPLIHVAEETGKVIQKKGLRKVALLGTRYTMEDTFFQDRLKKLNIETIVPNAADRDFIQNSIFQELSLNIFHPKTKKTYLDIIDRLVRQGAEGIILGCTEIPLLIKPEDCSVPIFDTTFIHASAAVDFALS